MPLPLLSGSTVLLTDENSLPNCSLNHSPITCPLMASASLDLSFGSFTTWKPASSVVNFRNTFPETWEIVRLAYICRLMDGEKKEGNYVCLDAKYLRGKSSGGVLQKGRFVSTGDNIILVDGENSGEVFAVPHDGYMGSTFKQLWVNCNMHLPYVLYFIQFYKDLLRNSKKGEAIPHLNKDIFYSLVVGIPPYQEQKRIAKRIEEITNEGVSGTFDTPPFSPHKYHVAWRG